MCLFPFLSYSTADKTSFGINHLIMRTERVTCGCSSVSIDKDAQGCASVGEVGQCEHDVTAGNVLPHLGINEGS